MATNLLICFSNPPKGSRRATVQRANLRRNQCRPDSRRSQPTATRRSRQIVPRRQDLGSNLYGADWTWHRFQRRQSGRQLRFSSFVHCVHSSYWSNWPSWSTGQSRYVFHTGRYGQSEIDCQDSEEFGL